MHPSISSPFHQSASIHSFVRSIPFHLSKCTFGGRSVEAAGRPDGLDDGNQRPLTSPAPPTSTLFCNQLMQQQKEKPQTHTTRRRRPAAALRRRSAYRQHRLTSSFSSSSSVGGKSCRGRFYEITPLSVNGPPRSPFGRIVTIQIVVRSFVRPQPVQRGEARLRLADRARPRLRA